MIVWLDHLIFGNGRGLGSPFFDSRFYWLSGELYHFSPGLGAQLSSFQWTHPRADERRTLCNREFKPFSSSRRWGRVRVCWAMTDLPHDIDGGHAELRLLAKEIGTGFYSTKAERLGMTRAALATATASTEREG